SGAREAVVEEQRVLDEERWAVGCRDMEGGRAVAGVRRRGGVTELEPGDAEMLRDRVGDYARRSTAQRDRTLGGAETRVGLECGADECHVAVRRGGARKKVESVFVVVRLESLVAGVLHHGLVVDPEGVLNVAPRPELRVEEV